MFTFKEGYRGIIFLQIRYVLNENNMFFPLDLINIPAVNTMIRKTMHPPIEVKNNT